jgi:hypothetical protein
LETGGARGRKMAARAVSGVDARGSVGGALRWVLGGCGVAVALVALVVWQYPPVGAAAGRYALYGAGAAGALLAVAGAVALRGRRGRPGAVGLNPWDQTRPNGWCWTWQPRYTGSEPEEHCHDRSGPYTGV